MLIVLFRRERGGSTGVIDGEKIKNICICQKKAVPLQPFCGWKASGATKGTTNE